ncbi:hypothetical protein NPIL_465411 [Nephila pilipes]|uniref:Uncharacterized protein n=1 Tax=Nephila pilipes TaxID=299642 RepID=A0A8X6NTH4_NEPPI|nr:hypothetical protein NPIL_465411 [Nephila pilipes]
MKHHWMSWDIPCVWFNPCESWPRVDVDLAGFVQSFQSSVIWMRPWVTPVRYDAIQVMDVRVSSRSGAGSLRGIWLRLSRDQCYRDFYHLTEGGPWVDNSTSRWVFR